MIRDIVSKTRFLEWFHGPILIFMLSLIQTQSTIYSLVFTLFSLIPFTSIHLLNDYFDFKLDLKRRWRLRKELKRWVTLTTFFSIIFAFVFSAYVGVAMSLVIISNFIYSWKLKKLPFIDMISMASIHFLIFLLPLDLSFNSFYLASFFASLALVGHVLHSLRDVKRDRKKGYNYTAIFLGKQVYTFLSILVILVSTYLYSISSQLKLPSQLVLLYLIPLVYLIKQDRKLSLTSLRLVSFVLFLSTFINNTNF